MFTPELKDKMRKRMKTGLHPEAVKARERHDRRRIGGIPDLDKAEVREAKQKRVEGDAQRRGISNANLNKLAVAHGHVRMPSRTKARKGPLPMVAAARRR